jgi:hypothetical protein
MILFRRCVSLIAVIGLSTLTGAYAQVSSINSATITSRVFNDVPSATFSGLNNFPTSISLSETNVSAATGFANRDIWQFSNNGTSAYQFQNNDYFHVSFDLTLNTFSASTLRKETGFLFSTANHGDLQFIVDSDAHEVVQFGGIGFYSFNVNNGITYTSGQKITLGFSYFLDGNGRNAVIFTANGVNSPVQEFAAGDGIGNGSTLGGYFQIQNDSANPNNAANVLFQNITISSIPEPSVLALFGIGFVSFLLRRRQA